MSIDERIGRIEIRLDALVAAVGNLKDVLAEHEARLNGAVKRDGS